MTQPLVYVGPSAPQEDVRRWLPQACLRPPVRRGDLYRDRLLRYSLFVIIDGVFGQGEAVAPREVIDVIEDGAIVVGASSLGAIRAAECWPARMCGIGTIYRLFRSGALQSDDEVAVVFNSERPFPSLSVPLINIRYAVRQAVRAGLLRCEDERQITEEAAGTFYAERSWASILDKTTFAAGSELRRRLQQEDLKRRDAVRALRVVANWIRTDPSLLYRRRNGKGPFSPSDFIRERMHDAFHGETPDRCKNQVVQWLAVSGRYRSKALALAPALGFRAEQAAEFDCEAALAEPGFESGSQTAAEATVDSQDPVQDVQFSRHGPVDPWAILPRRLHLAGWQGPLVDALWDLLADAGECDAAVMRWRAVYEAAALARDRSWTPSPKHRFLAEQDIATAHGFPCWEELSSGLSRDPGLWSKIAAYRDELALAKLVRERLFSESWSDLILRPD